MLGRTVLLTRAEIGSGVDAYSGPDGLVTVGDGGCWIVGREVLGTLEAIVTSCIRVVTSSTFLATLMRWVMI